MWMILLMKFERVIKFLSFIYSKSSPILHTLNDEEDSTTWGAKYH